jgi:thermitase
MSKLRVLGIIGIIFVLTFSLGGEVFAAVGAIPGSEEVSFVADEILVKFEPGTSAADIAKFHRSQGASIKSEIPQIGVQVLRVPAGRVLEKVAAYEKNPNVVYAEPNYIRELSMDPVVPTNDYLFDYQWALNNTGQFWGEVDADIDWLEAYNTLGELDTEIIIAINDSGVDCTHPDLNEKVVVLRGSDIIGEDNDPSDELWHGTHVAGIAAAETNNTEGIAGVAFATSIKIMPVRIFDANGSTNIETICNGLAFAANNGAKVINMSYGGTRKSKAEADAVKYAWNKGAVLVAAAGNYGQYINAATWKNYPAAYPEVIAVSATDDYDFLAYYSSYGGWLSVAAPGGDMILWEYSGIISTYPTYLTPSGYLPYAWAIGTSMAAPHVSGLAALLFAQNPDRSNQEVRTIIENTADDLGADGFDSLYGYGRINVYNAVTYAAPPPPTPPPSPGGDTMHVAAIDMSYTTGGPNKFVYTKVKIVDAAGIVAVPEAMVYLETTLPDGSKKSYSGATNREGTVTFKLKSTQSGTYTSMVTDVVKDTWVYEPGANVETNKPISIP